MSQRRLKGVLKHYNFIHIMMFIVVIVLLFTGLFSLLFYFKLKHALYDSACNQPASSYYDSFYSGKKVMFLVPHEDDEYNLGSGVIEQYVNSGSDVKIVWLTNGDALGGGEIRIAESIKAMTKLNVPEENMIFLGYGDSWDAGDYEHIYHAPGDLVMKSECGLTRTYGTSDHPDYHTLKYGEPADYTRNNIISDITEVIMENKPDVIYAIDCDSHQDHRAMSLFTEEVLGNIFSKNNEYRPKVLKGFGYCTAWIGVRDYYDVNVLSTVSPYDTDYMQERPQYIWEDRVRLPVYVKNLAPTRQASAAYDIIASYDSQNALASFDCIVNSDKVFWERRSDSVMYDAKVTATSGEPEVINDFILCNSPNIKREDLRWKRGVWKTDESDKDMTVTIEFSEPKDINQVVLYDSCYKDSDVLGGYLTFSDGSKIETGPLNPMGDATTIDFDTKEGITGFSYTITEKTSDTAGVSEIEAYLYRPQSEPDFIKLTIDDNFAYDYRAQKGDNLAIGAYGYPCDSVSAECEISIDGQPLGDVILSNVATENLSDNKSQLSDLSSIFDYAYDGKKHTVRVALKCNPKIYDECYLSSYSFYDKIVEDYARKVEHERSGENSNSDSVTGSR